MKYDIRLIKLQDQVISGRDYKNLAQYSLDQSFAMGGNLVPLAQAFLSNLLVDPGSDIMKPNRGGGLMSLARRFNRVSSELEMEIRKAVARVELFMRNEQQARTMDPQERLKSAQLISVIPGDSPDEITVQILLQAESGDAVQLTV